MYTQMKTRVHKWGNSLGVRIPKTFASEIGIDRDSSIQMMVEEGALRIVPEREPSWTLSELLAGVTEANKPSEWDTGVPEGEEPW
jgi:antitoxin MazE